MKANDIISFIIEEAHQQQLYENAESALAACIKEKNQSGEACGNCKRTNHMTESCYSKGGAKEGQGPRQKKNTNKPETIVVAADDDKRDMFAFTCTSDHADKGAWE